MRGSAFRTLLAGLDKVDLHIHIPRVVLDEVAHKYEENLTECERSIDGALKKIQRLTGKVMKSPLSHTMIEGSRREFEASLKRALPSSKITIHEYPTILHRDVTERALSRRKPFGEDDRGYRDYLIWLTVVDVARTATDKTVLVTNNKHDFASADGNLHPDLVSDLADANLAPDAVKLYTSLDELNRALILPHLQALEGLRRGITQGSVLGVDLKSALEGSAVDFLSSTEIDSHDIGFPSVYEDMTVASVQDIGSIDLKNAYRLSQHEALLEVEAEAELEFEFYIPKSDAYTLSAGLRPFISDHDWNDYYVLAYDTAVVRLQLLVTVDESAMTVTSVELQSIERE